MKRKLENLWFVLRNNPSDYCFEPVYHFPESFFNPTPEEIEKRKNWWKNFHEEFDRKYGANKCPTCGKYDWTKPFYIDLKEEEE